MTERCKMDPYLVGSKSCFFWKKGKVEIVDDAEVQNRRNMMFTIREYVKVSSLEEAYELNQKKTNVIFGGGVWLRLGKKHIQTAIDLSALGLDGITEDADAFSIGCMTTLHTLEIHEGIHAYTKGAVRESLRHIVGVQMRNCATVGGSIFGRFGFSDILCCLMGLDCDVELYRGGRVALTDFTRMKKDTDILVRVILKKSPRNHKYLPQYILRQRFQPFFLRNRRTSTSFGAIWSIEILYFRLRHGSLQPLRHFLCVYPLFCQGVSHRFSFFF